MPTYPTYKLGEIAKIYNGNSINAEEKEKKYKGVDGRNYIGTKDIDFECSVNYNNGVKIPYDEGKFKIAPAESVLVCAEGGSAGKKSAFITEDVCFGNKLFAITNNQGLFDGNYVFYYTRYKRFFDLFKNELSGLIGGVSSKKFGEIPIPLPPLATQRAIVTRIETLFAELDKAVQHLRTAQQQLKTYRQAVLRNAFEGNLTKEWRNHNHISHETWEEKEFSSIAEIKSNLVDVADYKDYPHIAPDNIEKETGKLLEYHTIAEDGVISGKHRFFAGQILYSKIRPNLSKVIIVDFDGLCSADMYPIEAKGNTKFLWYQMLSDRFVDYASNSGSRTVLPKINQKGLSIIPMKICSIEEQNEVVIQIESRLSQATASETYIENALQQAEALRQSILKKAFSGELV